MLPIIMQMKFIIQENLYVLPQLWTCMPLLCVFQTLKSPNMKLVFL